MRSFHPWPVGLVVVFVVFISFQLGVIAHIAPGFEGPDDEHYYKHGLEYSEQIQQVRRQQSLGYRLGLDLPPRVGPTHLLRVSLADARGVAVQGARLQLDLGRPATRHEDCSRPLLVVSPGVYAVCLAAAPGVWDLKVTARIGRELIVEKRRVIVEATPGARPLGARP